MDRSQIYALILGLAAVNGLFSPYLDLVVALAPLWVPTWLTGSPSALFYTASLLTATTTLLASGIPAAIAERLAPTIRGTDRVLGIWAVSAAILTLPGLARLIVVVAG
jgi:hypothetical protein